MTEGEFARYQRESRKTWGLIRTDHPIGYPSLGLANEAGEVAGKVKKIFRDMLWQRVRGPRTSAS